MSHRSTRFIALLLPLLLSLPSWLARAADSPLAVRGYDVVAYFTWGRATPGNARFEHVWDEQRWRFASEKHLALFKADPARYAPQFNSYCAVALSRGERTVANPEYWLISDGRLYLFGKPAGPDLVRRNPRLLDDARQQRELTRPAQRAAE